LYVLMTGACIKVVDVPVYSNMQVPVAAGYQGWSSSSFSQSQEALWSSGGVQQGLASGGAYSMGAYSMAGQMVGLGMQLTKGSKSGHVRITQVVPGYAAFNSGQIRVGDRLEQVDQVPLDHVSMVDIDKYCLGLEGSWSSVVIRRGQQTFTVQLQRVTPGNEHGVDAHVRSKLQGIEHGYTFRPASGGTSGFPSVSL